MFSTFYMERHQLSTISKQKYVTGNIAQENTMLILWPFKSKIRGHYTMVIYIYMSLVYIDWQGSMKQSAVALVT